jgi:hypothetical protein
MTRKEYEAVASVVNLLAVEATRNAIARMMASELAPFNKAFDRARFIAVCGAVDHPAE